MSHYKRNRHIFNDLYWKNRLIDIWISNEIASEWISTTKHFLVVTVSCCTIKYLLHRNNFQEDRFREFRHNAQHCKPSLLLLSPLIQIKHGFMLDWNAGIYKGVAFCYLSISGKRLHINHFRCSKLTFLCSIMMKKY